MAYVKHLNKILDKLNLKLKIANLLKNKKQSEKLQKQIWMIEEDIKLRINGEDEE